MKRVFIGHRGVGKSTILERHKTYFPNIPHIDLDQYISVQENKKISEIFLNQGEDAFRLLENKCFQQLIQQENFVISVGAGFNTNNFSSSSDQDIEIVYISRRTDSDGRVFLNRPRLNVDMTAIEESKHRFIHREEKFRKIAHWVYHLPEGLSEVSRIEKNIFNKNTELKSSFYTLKNKKELKWVHHLNQFELRTDYFSYDEIQEIVRKYTGLKFIISIRKIENDFDKYYLLKEKNIWIDWAIDLAPCLKTDQTTIVSMHGNDFNLSKKEIEKYQHDDHLLLKLCPIVNSFDELEAGYKWQQEEPEKRSFLPRTDFNKNKKSLWRWFRCIMLKKQKINFIQSIIDFDDQPSLYQNEQVEYNKIETFGAVLGFPVHHSITPTYQYRLFNRSVFFVDIPIIQKDFNQAILFLEKLGLRYAAVTSPLKKSAAEFLRLHGLVDSQLQAINTLYLNHSKRIGISTDHFGFDRLLKSISLKDVLHSKIVIWGGGGVVESIQKIIPNVVQFSSQTGQLKMRNSHQDIQPDILIWAAPRYDKTQFPPVNWTPQIVVDLNYTENSMGLEYAQTLLHTKYVSGLIMFEEQGLEQYKFWLEQI